MSADAADIAAVLAAVLAGDDDSFHSIAAQYETALMRVAFSRLGQRDQAEEAVQETFLNAFRSLHTYDSHYSFRTWLWTILLNQCRRQYQKKKRTPATVSWDFEWHRGPPISHPEETITAENIAITQEKKMVLDSLLDKLPPNQADAYDCGFTRTSSIKKSPTRCDAVSPRLRIE